MLALSSSVLGCLLTYQQQQTTTTTKPLIPNKLGLEMKPNLKRKKKG
jgi:hypothetical protein